MTCDFQQCGILTNVDSVEPEQPPFKLRNSKRCSVSLNTHRIFKRPAKALISLGVCAGLFEPLLVANATLLEISCTGSLYSCHPPPKLECQRAHLFLHPHQPTNPGVKVSVHLSVNCYLLLNQIPHLCK